MSRTAIKISIIGAGFVGSTAAYTLMMKGIASEIVLVDATPEKAIGEAMDIEHGSPFAAESVVRAGGYEDTHNSDIVIITAGTNQKPGETRIDLIIRNAAIMRDVAGQVAEQSPNAVVLIVSNPVDVMTYVFRDVTGFPKNRVIGSGTNLDSARLRYLLNQKFGIDSHSIHAQVWGEHGDSEFPVWSLVRVAGMSINEASNQFGGVMADSDYNAIGDMVRNAAYEVINRKGATYYGIGMSIARICETILRDEKSVLPVSVLLHGEYGIDDVYLSLPAVLGEHGVEKVLTPGISDDELSKLHHSAAVLKEARAQI
ncbi:MAG: L-lactate dehydrogenase [Candidatus Nomurabacteria bacterium]|jgi:L-lactate dehydrogenase|nr:L-lactate dehydrogenase [Candidatus Nomurabacteria bacterium]